MGRERALHRGAKPRRLTRIAERTSGHGETVGMYTTTCLQGSYRPDLVDGTCRRLGSRQRQQKRAINRHSVATDWMGYWTPDEVAAD